MGKKILSEDSRERLVAAYEKTKDISTVVVMFGVAESTVYRLAAQKRKTGSLALQTHKRGGNLFSSFFLSKFRGAL